MNKNKKETAGEKGKPLPYLDADSNSMYTYEMIPA